MIFKCTELGERGLDEPLIKVKHFQKLSTGMQCSIEKKKKNQVDQMGFLFFLETHDSGYVFARAFLALCSHPDISTAVACQSQEPEGSVLLQDVWAELLVAPVL